MGNLAHSPQNDQRRDDFMKDVREFGRESASGKDALPKLAMRVVRAANDGVIDTTKDKDQRDDAAKIYEEYCKSESKKQIHAHSDNGTKANVSKLRQLVLFGQMTTCDPVAVLDRAAELRAEMVKAEEKVLPVYAGFVAVAREQLDNTTGQLDDDAIKAAQRKPEPKEKTLEKELQAIATKLEKIITGEAGVRDQSEHVIAAHDAIKQRLAAMMQQSELDAFMAKAKDLGMVVSKEQMQAAIDAERDAQAKLAILGQEGSGAGA